jgi:hypothetical protein
MDKSSWNQEQKVFLEGLFDLVCNLKMLLIELDCSTLTDKNYDIIYDVRSRLAEIQDKLSKLTPG